MVMPADIMNPVPQTYSEYMLDILDSSSVNSANCAMSRSQKRQTAE